MEHGFFCFGKADDAAHFVDFVLGDGADEFGSASFNESGGASLVGFSACYFFEVNDAVGNKRENKASGAVGAGDAVDVANGVFWACF